MEKREQQRRTEYDYDDKGVMQVSQQIMDSYNSGVIGQEQMKQSTENPEQLK